MCRCHYNVSGYEGIFFMINISNTYSNSTLGPWSPTPDLFNKGYFELLMFLKWTPVINLLNNTQYVGNLIKTLL
jgi:hypothetical protein